LLESYFSTVEIYFSLDMKTHELNLVFWGIITHMKDRSLLVLVQRGGEGGNQRGGEGRNISLNFFLGLKKKHHNIIGLKITSESSFIMGNTG